MRLGEIRLADLEPGRGSEADKQRPVILVSNDGAIRRAEQLGRGVVTVVPVTSNVTRIRPFQTFLPGETTGLRRDSKAQTEQVRSIDVGRLGAPVGRLSPEMQTQLDEALRLHLTL